MNRMRSLFTDRAVVVASTIRRSVPADNLAGAASKASLRANRTIAANSHALEEFPELLRGCSVQTEKNRLYQTIRHGGDNE